MDEPLVSVLMPVWNLAAHVGDAIESIRCQTLQDFEFVIVDDGSTDATGAVLDAAARRDRRLRVIRHDTNKGLRAALNTGLDAARAPLIARQDADDLAEPHRLARQVSVMAAEPCLLLLGSAYRVVGEDGVYWHTQRMPESDTAIRWRLLFDNPVSHTSAMFRRCLQDKTQVRYESFRCEDYDLWARLLSEGEGRNLSEPLVTRREHGETYTVRTAGPQAEARAHIALREIRRVWPGTGLTLVDVERIHRWDNELPSVLGPDGIRLCREVVTVLSAFCRQSKVVREEARAIARRWVSRILVALPDYRYRHAWTEGLLPGIGRLTPTLVATDFVARVRRRYGAKREVR
jgi:hypothetical protein